MVGGTLGFTLNEMVKVGVITLRELMAWKNS